MVQTMMEEQKNQKKLTCQGGVDEDLKKSTPKTKMAYHYQEG